MEIMMIVGLLTGLATLFLGQGYYQRRFEEAMPDIKLYRVIQLVIPVAVAGLFARYEYDALRSGQLIVLASLLILAGKIDKHEKIIPNAIIGVLLLTKAVALAIEFIFGRSDFAADFANGFLGFAVMAITLSVVRLIYKSSIGMGDIKLMVVIGLYLGVMRSMYILLVASIAAMAVSLVSMARKKMGMKDGLSFGPSIALGGLIVLILGI